MSELASHCPVCHQLNACSMAQGGDIGHCWCVTSQYDAVELIKQYVDLHPDILIRSDQCVCQSCLAQIESTVQQPAVVQVFKP